MRYNTALAIGPQGGRPIRPLVTALVLASALVAPSLVAEDARAQGDDCGSGEVRNPNTGQCERDRDCPEFSSQEEAQQFFESRGGPGQDPHRLDADDDGQACEEPGSGTGDGGGSGGGQDRDCPDFSSQEEAQRFFESQGGPGQDPHRLDADDDGQACEDFDYGGGSEGGSGDSGKPKGGVQAGFGGLAPRVETAWTARASLPFVVGGVLLMLVGVGVLIASRSGVFDRSTRA
jgi:Excalibur calcium-binding domain